jgi:RHS repeat-associated protein
MKAFFRSILCCVLSLSALCGARPALAEEGKSGLAAAHVKLPSGPGSLEGVGENFSPNLSMGVVSYGVPIEVPPGDGLAPELRLAYSSASGSSELGMGWALPIPRIERMTARGLPDYDADDLFASGAGEELVRLSGSDYYRARFERGFVRYEWRDAAEGKRGYWVAEYPDGRVGYFGATAAGQLVDAARTEGFAGTFAYALVELVDPLQHRLVFTYEKSGLRPYLTRVEWAFINAESHYRVELKYEARQDVLSDCKPGVEVLLGRRLTDVDVLVAGELLRRYHLDYEPYSATLGLTRLAGVRRFGTRNDTPYPIAFSFDYTGSFDPGCMDGGSCTQQVVTQLGSVGRDFKTGTADLIDLNLDHLPDVIDTTSGVHRIHLQDGEGGGFLPAERSVVAGSGAMQLRGPAVRMLDIDGDGAADMVDSANQRFLLNEGTGDWTSLEDFDARLPDIAADASLRFFDVDYDRYIDAVHIDRAGAWYFRNEGDHQFSSTAQLLELSGVGFVQDALQLADLNGDGMQDLVQPLAEGLSYRMNLGHGRFSAPLEMAGFPATWKAREVELFDVNGDGLGDALLVLGNEVRYALNRNGREFSPQQVIAEVAGELPERTPQTSLRFADMNGSGSTDIVWITPAGEVTFLDLFPRRPHLLSRVSNGIGKVLEVRYGNAVEHMKRDGGPSSWELRLPHVMLTLDELVIFDQLSGTRHSQSFHYRNGYYDGKLHQFRGFRDVEVTTAGEESVEQGLAVYRFEVGELDPYRVGLLLSEEQLSAGRSLKVQERTYLDCPVEGVQNAELPVRFVCEASAEQELREGQASSAWIRTRSSVTHDGYGNVVASAKQGVVSVGGGACPPCDAERKGSFGGYCGAACLGDEAFSETSFVRPGAATAGRWLLRAPTRILTFAQQDAVRSGAAYTEELVFYDGEAFEGLPLGQLERGLVTRRSQRSSADALVHVERNQHDEQGNVIALLDPNGARRELAYDERGLLLVHEDILFEGDDQRDPYRLRQALTYDPLHEKPISSSAWTRIEDDAGRPDVALTAYAYDQFGRLVGLAKPGDTLAAPTQEFDYRLQAPVSSIATRTRADREGAELLESIQCFDGLGRAVQTRSRIREGSYQASGFSVFTASGGVGRAYQPYRSTSAACADSEPGSSVPFEETTFDAAGRQLVKTRPDARSYAQYGAAPSRSRTSYEPLAVIEHDAEDEEPNSSHYRTPSLVRKDGQERTIRVERLLARDAEPVVAAFGYDAAGYLSWFRGPDGSLKTQVNDLLGRAISTTDADTGTTQLLRDAIGNVLRRTDARGATTVTAYDEASRPLRRYDDDAPTTSLIEWFYDDYPECDAADCSGGAGQLLATRYPLAGEERGEDRYGFDRRGRQRFFSRRLMGQELRFGFEFDNADRQVAKTFPDGFRLASFWDGLSRPVSAAGRRAGEATAIPVIRAADYDERGLLQSLQLANGVTTTHQYDDVLRLRRLSTIDAQSKPLQGYAYAYDRVGNLVSVDDEMSDGLDVSATARYEYDSFYRLVKATLDPDGAAAEGLAFEYDSAERLLSKTSDRGDASLTHVGGYEYGTDGAGPHAVSRAGHRQYRYDAAGNAVFRHRQRLGWDYQGRLARADFGSQRQSDLGYGPGTERVLKREGASITLYVTPDFEVRDGIATIYVSGPSGKVARIEGLELASQLLPDSAPSAAPDARITAADAYSTYHSGDVELASTELLSSARRALAALDDGLEFLHQDHVGSTSLTTDMAGKVRQRTEYYPFGEVRQASHSLENHSFAGREHDRGSGLSYHGARYLDVTLARWTSADPLFSTLGSPHSERDREAFAYSYALNSPLNGVDATGTAVGDPWHVSFGKYVVGAVYGTVQSLTPGGFAVDFVGRPSNDSDFLLGQAAGQIVTGAMQMAAGGSMAGGGTGLLVTSAGVLAPAGVPLAAAGVAVALQGATNAGEGGITLLAAVKSRAAEARTTQTVFHKHHTIPREILKHHLPADVAKAVRGKAGAPNRWSIPEDLHKAIHKGAGGGAYNETFKERLSQLGRQPTADDVLQIRDDLVQLFGLEGYRP